MLSVALSLTPANGGRRALPGTAHSVEPGLSSPPHLRTRPRPPGPLTVPALARPGRSGNRRGMADSQAVGTTLDL